MITRGMLRNLCTRALLALVVLLASARAFAQEAGYEPVTGSGLAKTDPNPYIVAAYGFIWAALLLYVISIARGLAKARTEVAELRRRVGGGA